MSIAATTVKIRISIAARVVWIDVGPLEVPQIRRPNSRPALPGKLRLSPHCTASVLPFAATLRYLDMYQASQAKAKQANHQTHTHMPIACETKQS
jgi:hypothetical protein